MGLGHDESVIYQRETKQIEYHQPLTAFEKELLNLTFETSYYEYDLYTSSCLRMRTLTHQGYIGFCGWAYPYYESGKYWYTWEETTNDILNAVGIYAEEIRGLLEGKNNSSRADRAISLTKKRFERGRIRIDDEIFRQLGTPIFRMGKTNKGIGEINPCLRDMGFQRVIDPYQCFQEIEMYLSNILTPRDTIAITSGDDKVLAQVKGFDEQSFKQARPGAKKEQRRANKLRKGLTRP